MTEDKARLIIDMLVDLKHKLNEKEEAHYRGQYLGAMDVLAKLDYDTTNVEELVNEIVLEEEQKRKNFVAKTFRIREDLSERIDEMYNGYGEKQKFINDLLIEHFTKLQNEKE